MTSKECSDSFQACLSDLCLILLKYFAYLKFILTFAIRNRGVEQLVARRAHNPEAGGSSPPPATTQDSSSGLSFFRVPKSPAERTARAI